MNLTIKRLNPYPAGTKSDQTLPSEIQQDKGFETEIELNLIKQEHRMRYQCSSIRGHHST